MSTRSCIVTCVKDDFEFFPIWLKYYSQFFDPDQIFVFDNHSTAEFRETHLTGLNRIPFPGHLRDDLAVNKTLYQPFTFEAARAKMVSDFCNGMLGFFDRVIATDVDEIIAPGASHDYNLGTYLQAMPDLKFAAPLGINLMHLPKIETTPLDMTQPVLSQRSYAHISYPYSKPVIRSQRTMWGPGFHGCTHRFDIAPDLYLFHIRDMDIDLRREGHARRHAAYLARGKAHRSNKRLTPDEAIDRYLGRLERSEIHEEFLTEIDPGYFVKEVRPGYFRTVDADGEIKERKRFDIYRIPPAFRTLF